MKKDMQEHLGKDRLLAAFVDRADISPSEREHLEHCDSCEKAVQGLAGQLHRIADEARRHTPRSRVKVELPETEAMTRFGLNGKWIAAPALAAVCIVLLFLFLQPGLFTASRPYGDISLAEEAAADARLMAEINDIQDGGLASSMDEAAASPALDIDSDEEFLDELVPLDTEAHS